MEHENILWLWLAYIYINKMLAIPYLMKWMKNRDYKKDSEELGKKCLLIALAFIIVILANLYLNDWVIK